jgi:hypothetical protein
MMDLESTSLVARSEEASPVLIMSALRRAFSLIGSAAIAGTGSATWVAIVCGSSEIARSVEGSQELEEAVTDSGAR